LQITGQAFARGLVEVQVPLQGLAGLGQSIATLADLSQLVVDKADYR